MELQLRLEGPESEKEIREIEKWLRDEEIGDLNIGLDTLPPSPGTLGDVATILTVLAEATPPLLALAVSLVNHFRARPPHASSKLVVSRGDTTITLEGADLVDEARIRETMDGLLGQAESRSNNQEEGTPDA